MWLMTLFWKGILWSLLLLHSCWVLTKSSYIMLMILILVIFFLNVSWVLLRNLIFKMNFYSRKMCSKISLRELLDRETHNEFLFKENVLRKYFSFISNTPIISYCWLKNGNSIYDPFFHEWFVIGLSSYYYHLII